MQVPGHPEHASTYALYLCAYMRTYSHERCAGAGIHTYIVRYVFRTGYSVQMDGEFDDAMLGKGKGREEGGKSCRAPRS